MAKTVVGLFDRFDEAQNVVQDLVESGFQASNISVLSRDAHGEHAPHVKKGKDRLPEEVGTMGAVGGSIFGGITGILVGIGALTIPGVGPVVAAGPFLSVLGSTLIGAGLGAAAGGLVGALVGAGLPKEDANYYAEGVRRGGTLVLVDAAEDMARPAADIMQRHNAVDIDTRAEEWRRSGWTGFDPHAAPYRSEEVDTRRRGP